MVTLAFEPAPDNVTVLAEAIPFDAAAAELSLNAPAVSTVITFAPEMLVAASRVNPLAFAEMSTVSAFAAITVRDAACPAVEAIFTLVADVEVTSPV
jgi:hypothetical protein